jgi:PHD/YefM family antitoxin component YafN of YafNO toxin-antitoxin module
MATLTITSDKPVVVIPADEYEDLLERLEILSDKQLLQDLREARKDLAAGKTVSLEELLKELNEN